MTQEETGGKTYWKAAALEAGGVESVAQLMPGLMHFIFFCASRIVF